MTDFTLVEGVRSIIQMSRIGHQGQSLQIREPMERSILFDKSLRQDLVLSHVIVVHSWQFVNQNFAVIALHFDGVNPVVNFALFPGGHDQPLCIVLIPLKATYPQMALPKGKVKPVELIKLFQVPQEKLSTCVCFVCFVVWLFSRNFYSVCHSRNLLLYCPMALRPQMKMNDTLYFIYCSLSIVLFRKLCSVMVIKNNILGFWPGFCIIIAVAVVKVNNTKSVI